MSDQITAPPIVVPAEAETQEGMYPSGYVPTQSPVAEEFHGEHQPMEPGMTMPEGAFLDPNALPQATMASDQMAQAPVYHEQQAHMMDPTQQMAAAPLAPGTYPPGQDIPQAAPPMMEAPSMETPIYSEAPQVGDPYQQQAHAPQQTAYDQHPPMYQETYTQPAAAMPPLQEEDMSHIRPVPRVSIEAFCESDSVAAVIDRASNDRRMAKAHVNVQMGGINAAVAYYQTAATPNLILIESRQGGNDLINQLHGLAEVCDEGTNVMVIGHQNDVTLYRELISRGVSEYLVAPIKMGELMGVVNELFVNPEADPLGQSISFVGAKGGVGSSTLSHNVAFAISSGFKSDVIIADLDLAFGTANIDFDQDPAQGMAEAVFSSDRIDDTYLDRLLAKCSDHLSLLAAPSTLDREYDFDAEDFRQVLEVAARGTPNVVLDVPHIWTGWAKSVLEASDRVVLTATPDLACLRNSKNYMDTLTDLRPNDEPPILVLNQVNVPKKPEISVDDFSEALGVKPAVVIPFDPALFGTAANNGQMLSEADPKSEIAASIDTLAQIVTGRRVSAKAAPEAKGASLLSGLFKKKK